MPAGKSRQLDMAEVVVDASAVVDLLLGNALGKLVATRLAGNELHAPGHLDAECLSALGRLHRAGHLTSLNVEAMLSQLASAPILRRQVGELIAGAWQRRSNLSLADALYVELADQLGISMLTTDMRLLPIGLVEVVEQEQR